MRKTKAKSEELTIKVNVKKEGLAPALGAAFLLTDRAFVSLSGDRERSLTVVLRPKVPAGAKGLKALADSYARELATQKVRWAIAENNRPVREYIAEQAVLVAQGRRPAAAPAASPASDDLTDAQRLEIEKLIAEVESEIKTLGEKKAASDPKKIAASWEEKEGRQ